jgi:hypothetical protein
VRVSKAVSDVGGKAGLGRARMFWCGLVLMAGRALEAAPTKGIRARLLCILHMLKIRPFPCFYGCANLALISGSD